MSKKRLNLSVDRAAFDRARRYSIRHGRSISSLVSGFLAGLPDSELDAAEHSPTVRRLRGIARGERSRDAYRDFLAEKHGV